MAIISKCVYDAQGRLMEPDRLDIVNAMAALDMDNGGFPTFKRGFTHILRVTASGLTAEHARYRVNERLDRFFGEAELVGGFRKISMHKTEGIVPCNRNYSITYEIIYAIEAPRWARNRRPESPNAGYRRDGGFIAQR